MFVIVVSASSRLRATVPGQPALGADHDATDLDHDTTLGAGKASRTEVRWADAGVVAQPPAAADMLQRVTVTTWHPNR